MGMEISLGIFGVTWAKALLGGEVPGPYVLTQISCRLQAATTEIDGPEEETREHLDLS